jgi:predicted Fe-S protein YdhL (DUF1289 family)
MALDFKPLASSAELPPEPAVPSPCIQVCRMDARSGLCQGCGRTIEEITLWSRLSEAGKRQVWAALPERGFPGLESVV